MRKSIKYGYGLVSCRIVLCRAVSDIGRDRTPQSHSCRVVSTRSIDRKQRRMNNIRNCTIYCFSYFSNLGYYFTTIENVLQIYPNIIPKPSENHFKRSLQNHNTTIQKLSQNHPTTMSTFSQIMYKPYINIGLLYLRL